MTITTITTTTSAAPVAPDAPKVRRLMNRVISKKALMIRTGQNKGKETVPETKEREAEDEESGGTQGPTNPRWKDESK